MMSLCRHKEIAVQTLNNDVSIVGGEATVAQLVEQLIRNQ